MSAPMLTGIAVTVLIGVKKCVKIYYEGLLDPSFRVMDWHRE